MTASLEGVQWRPVLQVFPNYVNICAHLRSVDKFGTRLLEEQLLLNQNHVCVAMKPIPSTLPPGPQQNFPYAMVWPITITSAVTEASGVLSQGAVLALTDMLTSLHVMLAFMPTPVGHVSVSMQSNRMQIIREEDTILVITRIDKMGKRLVFTTAEFIRSMLPATAQFDFAEIGIDAATRCYSLCGNVKHIKSVLSPGISTTK
ncbi:thioesterase superfamily protein [Trypanosoma rangeli]|uniref:Thioesterase superfamily protein n=1 Tax=Trypanosoma rangeli TaxID=5698 RepID=A0A3R7KAU9_TRYRA|nr:thioesterase superfamily protein [Trypanosoma rangeli]RNF02853.1 thioesterase superfamily protein [Trypanosoma rangeli]|eukprot:RNF02853.1 thioesterase superfamily protein [Trypanosoma rangeli]